MTEEIMPPEHQPGAPYHSELIQEARELAQCHLCKEYDDLEHLQEVEIDEPKHWRLVCKLCLEKSDHDTWRE